MTNSQLNVKQISDVKSEFSIEPLDPGFGYSIGSALRRVLLSSIEGLAITAVNIEGVEHEFSTLQGLREDISEFLLNLRELRFSHESLQDTEKQSWEIQLDVSEKGDIHASSFQLPAGIQLINGDKVIGHLNEGGELHLAAVLEVGQGFLPAQEDADDPIGTIRLDASFSPVEKVAYSVGSARIGQRTDYDSLTLVVETDGTRTPQSVVDEAVHVLRSTLDVFSPPLPGTQSEQNEYDVDVPVYSSTPEDNASTGLESVPIEELELGVRAFNCLVSAHVETLGDLLQYSEKELASIPNFGKKSFQEVLDSLKERGLSLRES